MQPRTKLTLIIIAVIMFAFFILSRNEVVIEEPVKALTTVELTTSEQFAGDSSVVLVGIVRAFSEAAITAEQPGRVTGVRVKLGDFVQAGQIIATLENASQQAAVLQAEGSYDAAVAAAAQSDIGASEAQNQVNSTINGSISNIKNAYGTVNSSILTNIDKFFSNPNGSLPGLKIDGVGETSLLNSERVAFQNLLPTWKSRNDTLTKASDLDDELVYSIEQVRRTIDFVDTFIRIFDSQNNSARYSDEELVAFISEFNGVRTNLVDTQTLLNNSTTQLVAARESLERANLASSGGQNSAADAQVKQALGGLRAAQANLAKTIIRTPIAGTVNSLSVRTGDFVSGQQQIAEVANNDALEIVTAVGEQERDLFSVGDTVTLKGGLAGTVTEIAPAIDQTTGKIEVRIAAESSDLKNGDIISLFKTASSTSSKTSNRIFVPLSAVKFQQTDGFVFTVVDNALESKAVTIGTVRGGSVEILTGLTSNQAFVRDTRGLQAGDKVEVIN